MAEHAVTIRDLLIAIVGGFTPAFLWLWFWFREEDPRNPEPVGLLILTFIAGFVSVFLLIPLGPILKQFDLSLVERLFVFALIEETVKFLIVALIDFTSSYVDEPIDYAVYLITGALGFAASENVLYLLSSQVRGNIAFIIETGTLRFLGPTILHSILAAIMGTIIGFVFYKKLSVRFFFAVVGIFIVTILHTFFNYFIIEYHSMNGFLALGILWVVTLIVISLLEKVKKVTH